MSQPKLVKHRLNQVKKLDAINIHNYKQTNSLNIADRPRSISASGYKNHAKLY